MIKVFFRGLVIGLIFWSISINWIFDAINFYGAGYFLSFCITALLIFYLSLYFGFFTFLIKFFEGNKFFVLLVPSLIFILEWVRSWMISGFPWLNIGIFSVPINFTGYLPLIGVSGTSFIFGLIIVLALKISILRIGSIFLLLLVGFLSPNKNLFLDEDSRQLKIAVVQPVENNYEILNNLTLQAKNDGAEVIIWPEAVSSYQNFQARTEFADIDIIGGFFVQQDEKIFTSIINTSTNDRYDKRNLVPFGEFQPFDNLLKNFNEFFNIPNSSLTRGEKKQKKVLIQQIPFSGLICWELSFNDTFVDRTRNTGFIIHISNDSWYGKNMPAQHLLHAKARAIESQKWVVRSTTDGISDIISPYNQKKLSENIPKGIKSFKTETISTNMKNTTYLIFGDYPLLIFSFIIILLAVIDKKRNEK